ncbi:hypothetical protein LTR85_011361 [Meristemomyces frigidus]|nr:hypothetical protein LTR85_011361 [Meristemomyces frigidus]
MAPTSDETTVQHPHNAPESADEDKSAPYQDANEILEPPEVRLMRYYIVDDSEQEELDRVRAETAAERKERSALENTDISDGEGDVVLEKTGTATRAEVAKFPASREACRFA